MLETRMAILWPMDEHGLVRGEDSHTVGAGFAGIAARKLTVADLGLA